MMTLLIEALEQRTVAIGDVPGAYLHAIMKDLTILKFTGELVELLLYQADKNYEKFITYERGEKVIYVKLKKALYGYVLSALL